MAHPLLWHFASSLAPITEFFAAKEPRAIPEIVLFVVLKWPATSPVKQIFFLRRLMGALNRLSVGSVELLVPHIKRLLNLTVTGTSEKVALAFAEFFLASDGSRLLRNHGQVLIPVFVPILAELSTEHWSHYVRQAASVAMIAFRREDGRLVEEAMRAMAVSGAPPQLASWMYVFRGSGVSVKEEYGILTEIFPVKRDKTVRSEARTPRARASSERPDVVKPRWAAKSVF
jgi:hypothetical protein